LNVLCGLTDADFQQRIGVIENVWTKPDCGMPKISRKWLRLEKILLVFSRKEYYLVHFLKKLGIGNIKPLRKLEYGEK